MLGYEAGGEARAARYARGAAKRGHDTRRGRGKNGGAATVLAAGAAARRVAGPLRRRFIVMATRMLEGAAGLPGLRLRGLVRRGRKHLHGGRGNAAQRHEDQRNQHYGELERTPHWAMVAPGARARLRSLCSARIRRLIQVNPNGGLEA